MSARNPLHARRPLRGVLFGMAAAVPALPGTAADLPQGSSPLTDLAFEDLMKIEVTTVSRRPQRLSDTAAAVSVLTGDDIRRAGATSIPDALRLIPGVSVARIDGTKWAVSIRGFNAGFANKLLVLVDGRSVYSPLFSGTFWDGPDTMLEDIDRIEVIRGPGAAIWGSNAVNGVVNIITKRAADTQGGLVSAVAGTTGHRLSARYGGTLDDGTTWRLYGVNVDDDESRQIGSNANGGVLRQTRVGFRADKPLDAATELTVQGEAYDGTSGGAPSLLPSTTTGTGALQSIDSHPSGYHLKGRWQHTLAGGSSVAVDAYVDQTRRTRAVGLTDEVQTWDLGIQHNVALGNRHALIWGGGYRTYRYSISSNPWFTASPANSNEELMNVFAQDEIALVPERLRLTLGLKLERSSLVGSLNPQPDVRLSWNPTEHDAVWLAASRANRLPSVLERSGSANALYTPAAPPGAPLPIIGRMVGDPAITPEKLDAYQVGYRHQIAPGLSVDATAFAYRYKQLILTGGAPTCVPVGFSYVSCTVPLDGVGKARTHGAELAVDWHIAERLRFAGSYTYADTAVWHPVNTGHTAEGAESRTPYQGLTLQSFFEIDERWAVDATVRYVDRIRGTAAVSDYWAMDAHLAWRLRKDVELSLIGRNLFDGRHPEFNSDPFFTATEQRRSLFARMLWNF